MHVLDCKLTFERARVESSAGGCAQSEDFAAEVDDEAVCLAVHGAHVRLERREPHVPIVGRASLVVEPTQHSGEEEDCKSARKNGEEGVTAAVTGKTRGKPDINYHLCCRPLMTQNMKRRGLRKK